MLEIGVLGPLQLSSGGAPVAVKRARERALFSLLTIDVGKTLSKDRLIDAVWAESPPANPVAALQTAISRLRKAIGVPVIATKAGGYTLEADPAVVDAVRFEDLISRSHNGDPVSNLGRLERALELWRGTPYSEFAHEDFAHSESARLEELRVTALEQRVEALLELGRHEEATPDLHRLVKQYPLREGLWGHLMVALYRSGRQAEALSVYQTARTNLGEQLGLEPGPRLRQLEEQILTQDSRLDVNPSVNRRPAIIQTPERYRLPSPIAPIVGRDLEQNLLMDRLATSRLVTITGSPGVGKSRLAIEVGNKVTGDFQDGAGYVGLDAHPETTSFEELIASFFVMTKSEPGSAVERAISVARGWDRLIIFDGCEPWIEDLPTFIARLLESCPGIKVLATSQQRLGIIGESVFSLLPLAQSDSPHGGSPAMDLFLNRAMALREERSLSDSDLESAARIVSSVDGLPLGIELAATRSLYVSFDELATELEERTDRLTNRDPTTPDKHRSLEAAIASSWDALDGAHQDLLIALSMLRTPWGFSSAALMTGRENPSEEFEAMVLDLADRSLVSQVYDERDKSQARFTILRVIRSFALRQVYGDHSRFALEQRHARVFAVIARDFAASMESKLSSDAGPSQLTNMLEERLPDIEAALQWLIANDPDEALSMAIRLSGLWQERQRKAECERWLRIALETSHATTANRGHALILLGMAIRPGSYLSIEGVSFARPFDHWRDPRRFNENRADRALESVELIRSGMRLLTGLGEIPTRYASVQLARSLATAGQLEEAKTELKWLDDDEADYPAYAKCFGAQMRARIALAEGDFPTAAQLARCVGCQAGEYFHLVFGIDTRGRIAMALGRWEEATGHYEELLEKYAGTYGKPGEAIVHLQLAALAWRMQEPERAQTHAGVALELGRKYGVPRIEPWVRVAQAWDRRNRGDDEGAEFYLNHAYQLSSFAEDGEGIARALIGFADLEWRRGNPRRALELIQTGLRGGTATLGVEVTGAAFKWCAPVLHHLGFSVEATKLLGAAESAFQRIQTHYAPAPGTDDPAAILKSTLDERKFEKALKQGRRMGLDSAIELALTIPAYATA